jgi:predicted RND superfamily exporter protein
VQNTGKAIFLTTATTCLAFSSFLVAEHPGMRPMGGTPVLGLIMAFIAAIIFLPALLSLIMDRKKTKGVEEVAEPQATTTSTPTPGNPR